ncbi:MAG: GntR family transcriptional regulator [Acidobacteriota bacterium]
MPLDVLARAESLSATPTYRDLSDWVVLKFLDGVRKGVFTPGQRLREEGLARFFGVSRAPVRHALHKLEQLGVIERRQPRGMYVRAWTDRDRAEILALLDALILLSVQLSIGRVTEESFAQLDQIISDTRAAASQTPNDQAQIERDANFHLIIARASGNRRLVELMEQLMLPLQLYVKESHEYFQADFWLRIHCGLLEALRKGDLDAAIACALRNARESRAMLLRETITDSQSQPIRPEQSGER